MSNQQPSSPLEAFFEWESQSCVEVVANMVTDERAVFMPMEKLRTYMTANNNAQLDRILTEIFAPDYPPIDPELILRDHLAVLCILLRMGSGISIEYFARYEELSDRRLPFDPSHPVAEFPLMKHDPTFLQRFCEKQQMYCVPLFDSFMQHKHFGRHRLLPITSRSVQETKGLATSCIIKLYGPHNRLLPKEQELLPASDANTFVLKSFPAKDGEDEYRIEVNGFRSVRNSDSVIRLYASYVHNDTLNLLLEYADKGPLEEYFRTQTPPSRGPDIVKFWESMFQLIKALKAVHSVRQGHLNVKPESIVVLSNGSETRSDWQFKLADFGVSSAGSISPEEKSSGQGSSSYAPPEVYNGATQSGGNSPSRSSWSADIWSLGCIYSEAAIWIADGYRGLQEYRQQRQDETDRVLFKGGDCFHDGEKVLQAVLDAHAEIEDRLRRSDNITKDVLDSMVDEMLWEEDRPNAKALWRKAEMVLTRSRQKTTAGSESLPSRSGSAQSQYYPPPRMHPPPMQPLPPIPQQRPSPYMSSISEQQQQPLNVERWRSQVTVPPPKSQFGGTNSDMASPTLARRQIAPSDTLSDLDREVTGSIASWRNEDNQSVTSPTTPFTSPPGSVNYDYLKHHPNEGRPRMLQNTNSYEYRRHPAMSRAPSYTSDPEYQDHPPAVPAPRYQDIPSPPPASRYQDATPPPPPAPRILGPTSVRNSQWSTGSIAADPRIPHDPRPLGRAASVAGSNRSSAYSGPSSHIATIPDGQNDSFMDALSYTKSKEDDAPVPPKSSKRMGGFSLFPTRSRNGSMLKQDQNHPPLPLPEAGVSRVTSRAPSVISSNATLPPMELGNVDGMDYLSINTCLEWKKAHKKVKKHSLVPPLPGASLLEDLKDRDHAFIIDDSASMAPVWADVQRTFSALSYVVKGMSPDGTELFFTISYDTYQRKDTTELCGFLEKHIPNGSTNISYRLNLQLQAYRLKLYKAKQTRAKPLKERKKTEFTTVRPLTIYVLTNGEWGEGPDPKVCIGEMATFLKEEPCPEGTVAIVFVSFATGAGPSGRISELVGQRFEMEMVDSERWSGNVLRMLRGPLDKKREVEVGELA